MTNGDRPPTIIDSGTVSALGRLWREVYSRVREIASYETQQRLNQHVLDEHGQRALVIVFDGATAVVTTGQKCNIEMPWAFAIEGWSLLADQSGSAVVDLNTATTYSAYPTVASICASAKPTLSSAQKNRTDDVSTWDFVLPRGCILQAEVESASTVTLLTLTLFLRAM